MINEDTQSILSSVQVLDIRNPEIFEQIPFIELIRRGIICVTDFLFEFYQHNTLKEYLYMDVNIKNMVKLAIKLEIFDEQDPEYILSKTKNKEKLKYDLLARPDFLSALWIFKSLRGTCNYACSGLLYYLNKYHPDEFRFSIFECKQGSELNYFSQHAVIIIYHNETKKFIIASPSNILTFDPYNPNDENFTVPQYNNENFMRSTNLIVADTFDEAINALKEMEGENSKWEEVLNRNLENPHYRTIDNNGNPQDVTLFDHIEHWVDNLN